METKHHIIPEAKISECSIIFFPYQQTQIAGGSKVKTGRPLRNIMGGRNSLHDEMFLFLLFVLESDA